MLTEILQHLGIGAQGASMPPPPGPGYVNGVFQSGNPAALGAAPVLPNGLVSGSTVQDVKAMMPPAGVPSIASPTMDTSTAPANPYVPAAQDPLASIKAAMDVKAAADKAALKKKKPRKSPLDPKFALEAILADALFNKGRGNLAKNAIDGYQQGANFKDQQDSDQEDRDAQIAGIDSNNELAKAQLQYNADLQQQAAKTKSDYQAGLEADRQQKNIDYIHSQLDKAKSGSEYKRWAGLLKGDNALDPALVDAEATHRDQANLNTTLPLWDKTWQGVANTFGEIKSTDLPALKKQAADIETANYLAPGTLQLPPTRESVKKQQIDQTRQTFLDNLHFKEKDATEKNKQAADRIAQGWANVHTSKERLGIAYRQLSDHEGQEDYSKYLQQYRAELEGYRAASSDWDKKYAEAQKQGGLIDNLKSQLKSIKARPDSDATKASDLAYVQQKLDFVATAAQQASDKSQVDVMLKSLMPRPTAPTYNAPAQPMRADTSATSIPIPAKGKNYGKSAAEWRVQIMSKKAYMTASDLKSYEQWFIDTFHQPLQ